MKRGGDYVSGIRMEWRGVWLWTHLTAADRLLGWNISVGDAIILLRAPGDSVMPSEDML